MPTRGVPRPKRLHDPSCQRDWGAGVAPVLVMLAVVLALSGCAGGLGARGDELPVSCLDRPDPGPCRAAQVRYFYDYHDNRCKPFRYGGCRGYVPFETLERCIDFCGAQP